MTEELQCSQRIYKNDNIEKLAEISVLGRHFEKNIFSVWDKNEIDFLHWIIILHTQMVEERPWKIDRKIESCGRLLAVLKSCVG